MQLTVLQPGRCFHLAATSNLFTKTGSDSVGQPNSSTCQGCFSQYANESRCHRCPFQFLRYCGSVCVCHRKRCHMFTAVHFSSGERLCADDLAVALLLLAEATVVPACHGRDSEQLKAGVCTSSLNDPDMEKQHNWL